MYLTLLFVHSLFRWLVLMSLLYAIFRAYRGYKRQMPFTRADDKVRHWTATIAHIQLMLGIILYTQSPIVKSYFSASMGEDVADESRFFGTVHIFLMLIAIVGITIGSAMAKRKPADAEKFKTMLQWFSVALLLILIAIPWPFSPLAHRPYFRSY